MLSNLCFQVMSLWFRLRDRFYPHRSILLEAGLRSDMVVLDYGCGPGGFTVAAARLVGPAAGFVYAIDVHPLALLAVEHKASNGNIKNILTLYENRISALQDSSIDMALLFDVLHHLTNPKTVLAEIHRLLRPEGILSVSDHHLKDTLLIAQIESVGLFQLDRRSRRTFSFKRKNQYGQTS